ncbi:MAG: dTDP-4-dehydrorhamnose reductase [Treponema sp.]|nr:dTDP-4-dehydrorhamnose reductase [Treponema sp.]
MGCRGMLGAELARLLEKTGVAYVGTDCDIDITNKAALAAFARGKSIGWIVNCAAYTAVDNAEDDAEACRALNADGPANIAALAHSIGAKLIHISTDYVFNGKGSRPYAETDAPDPIGVYGRTKYDGEKKLLAANAESYVVRSAWLYGAYGKNFVDTMLRLMRERDSVSVVNDQRGSPTWARDLASAIIALMKNPAPYGTYHFTGAGDCTWFEFAEAIYRKGREIGLLDKDCAVKACASSEYPAKVARPAYSVLDKQKIKTALGIDIPSWDASLTVFLQEKEIAP